MLVTEHAGSAVLGPRMWERGWREKNETKNKTCNELTPPSRPHPKAPTRNKSSSFGTKVLLMISCASCDKWPPILMPRTSRYLKECTRSTHVGSEAPGVILFETRQMTPSSATESFSLQSSTLLCESFSASHASAPLDWRKVNSFQHSSFHTCTFIWGQKRRSKVKTKQSCRNSLARAVLAMPCLVMFESPSLLQWHKKETFQCMHVDRANSLASAVLARWKGREGRERGEEEGRGMRERGERDGDPATEPPSVRHRVQMGAGRRRKEVRRRCWCRTQCKGVW